MRNLLLLIFSINQTKKQAFLSCYTEIRHNTFVAIGVKVLFKDWGD
jgi:hypothetical protein